jgi:hypothetical protein
MMASGSNRLLFEGIGGGSVGIAVGTGCRPASELRVPRTNPPYDGAATFGSGARR